MKYLSVMSLAIFVSVTAFAYQYHCISIDENEPYGIESLQFNTETNTFDMFFEGFDFWETYKVTDYKPQNEPLHPQIIMKLENWKNKYSENPVTPFYGDRELLTGGYKLRNGKSGGFIKTTGWGYSWAKYVCFRNKSLSIDCTSNENVKITGVIDQERAKFLLSDDNEELGLNSLTKLPNTFKFERYIRAKEDKYSFAKFSSDATAWESFAFSLPKTILSGEYNKEFKAYFTVFFDDGDHMLPDSPIILNCSLE